MLQSQLGVFSLRSLHPPQRGPWLEFKESMIVNEREKMTALFSWTNWNLAFPSFMNGGSKSWKNLACFWWQKPQIDSYHNHLLQSSKMSFALIATPEVVLCVPSPPSTSHPHHCFQSSCRHWGCHTIGKFVLCPPGHHKAAASCCLPPGVTSAWLLWGTAEFTVDHKG